MIFIIIGFKVINCFIVGKLKYNLLVLINLGLCKVKKLWFEIYQIIVFLMIFSINFNFAVTFWM